MSSKEYHRTHMENKSSTATFSVKLEIWNSKCPLHLKNGKSLNVLSSTISISVRDLVPLETFFWPSNWYTRARLIQLLITQVLDALLPKGLGGGHPATASVGHQKFNLSRTDWFETLQHFSHVLLEAPAAASTHNRNQEEPCGHAWAVTSLIESRRFFILTPPLSWEEERPIGGLNVRQTASQSPILTWGIAVSSWARAALPLYWG